jgi:hypothetical protein
MGNVVLLRGKANGSLLIILSLVIVFSVFLASGNIRLSPVDQEIYLSSYTCCDSGDGVACEPDTTKSFSYKGNEYGLLKTDITLAANTQFLADSGQVTPSGNRIYINTSQDSFYDTPPCSTFNRTRDLIGVLDASTNQLVWCNNIPDDAIVYVCKNTTQPCVSNGVMGRFDAYYRTSDGPVPQPISSCVKPTGAQVGYTDQQVISPSGTAARQNLQLQTFGVKQESQNIPWLSPL